eukprot:9361520-Pyramimonas_sp.AAC.2
MQWSSMVQYGRQVAGRLGDKGGTLTVTVHLQAVHLAFEDDGITGWRLHLRDEGGKELVRVDKGGTWSQSQSQSQSQLEAP